jgi:transcriptional regulator with XRE-family HTH domain
MAKRSVARRKASKASSKLAAVRLRRGMTQREVAAASGISYATYQRLERGEIDNPPLRYLTNCALVLGVRVGDLIEDAWLQWMRFDEHTPPAPTKDQRSQRWRDPR